jgi:hypothetical protein
MGTGMLVLLIPPPEFWPLFKVHNVQPIPIETPSCVQKSKFHIANKPTEQQSASLLRPPNHALLFAKTWLFSLEQEVGTPCYKGRKPPM